MARGDPLAQRPVAAAGAVGEHRLAVALDRGLGAVGQLLDGDAFGRRNAAREGDRSHKYRLSFASVRYLVLALLLALVAAAPAAAAPTAPCKLVTIAEAKAALGVSVTRKAETIGLFQSCMYKHGTSFLQIETRAISKADFVRSAKSNMRPVRP